jgi:zinc protease
LLLEDRVEFPRVYMAWRSPAMFTPGDADMDLLADFLANGKTSRLYRTLVYDMRIAVDVSAYQSSREIGSFFLLVATAAPGHTLDEIVAHVDDELRRAADEGPDADEMERALAQSEAHFMYRLQTVGGFGGKSDQLNAYNVLQGDPGFFIADLDRYRCATRESVQAAAREYLPLHRRVLLSVVPSGQHASAVRGSVRVEAS